MKPNNKNLQLFKSRLIWWPINLRLLKSVEKKSRKIDGKKKLQKRIKKLVYLLPPHQKTMFFKSYIVKRKKKLKMSTRLYIIAITRRIITPKIILRQKTRSSFSNPYVGDCKYKNYCLNFNGLTTYAFYLIFYLYLK